MYSEAAKSCACPLDLVLMLSIRAAALSLREGGVASSLPLRVGGGAAGASLFAFLPAKCASSWLLLEWLGAAVRAVSRGADVVSAPWAQSPCVCSLRLLVIQNYGVLFQEASSGLGGTSP